MEYAITFGLAFAGAWLAFAMHRRALVRDLVAGHFRSTVEAQRLAADFTKRHRYLVHIAAEVDRILASDPAKTNAEIVEAVKAVGAVEVAEHTKSWTPYGILFGPNDVAAVLRPEDVGAARLAFHWPTRGVVRTALEEGGTPFPKTYAERVENGLKTLALDARSFPEWAADLTVRDVAREVGFADRLHDPPPDAREHLRAIESATARAVEGPL